MTTSFTRARDGAVIVVTLTRPPINALDQGALDGLSEIVEEVDNDGDLRVLVFASGVTGVFCSGGDLKYWRGIHDADRVSQAGCEVFTRIERLSKPTIAVIDGHVIGGQRSHGVVGAHRVSSPMTAELMSIFERYLSVWVALCIVAGIVLGRLGPGLVKGLSRLEVSHVNLPIAVRLFINAPGLEGGATGLGSLGAIVWPWPDRRNMITKPIRIRIAGHHRSNEAGM